MKATFFLFCADPLDLRSPEPDFIDEVRAAEAAGFSWALLDHDALTAGDARAAVRRVRIPDGTPLVYRGWMMSPSQYTALSGALASRGGTLINAPEAYRVGHHLPAAYPFLRAHTAPTVWVPAGAGMLEAAVSAAAGLAGGAIVKDYVKSLKHHWAEACFIPDVSDPDGVRRVVGRFLELRGGALEGGLVLRQALPLAWLGSHPDSGAPIADEHRRFYLDGALLVQGRYWEAAGAGPPEGLFADVAAEIPSRLFSMDVARLADGGWCILEIGDGQVSGLVPGISAAAFYGALRGRC